MTRLHAALGALLRDVLRPVVGGARAQLPTLVLAATLAAPAAAQSPSLRCPTLAFDSAATSTEQARFLTIRTALGTTYTVPDSAGGPLGCPSDKAKVLSEAGWTGIAQRFQRGWILLGRGGSAGSEVAAVKGLNAWFVWWKGLPSELAVSQDTIKFAPQPGGSVVGPLDGMRAQGPPSERVTLWKCSPAPPACGQVIPMLGPVAGPFDAAAQLGVTDLARPNAASPYPRVQALFPSWLSCYTRVPFTDADPGEDHFARATVMMRGEAGCPLTLREPWKDVLQGLEIFQFPEGQLPGTGTDASPCQRKGELDVSLVQLLHLVLEYRQKLSPAALGHMQYIMKPWGGRPRKSPYVEPDGTCLGFGVIETENHILLQETARYLINDLIRPVYPAPEYDNTENRDWLLRFMQQLVRRDFYEFNALPYTRYSTKAILALKNYAPDSTVRVAATGVLDWLFIKQALSGNMDRDHRPFRRRPERDRLSAIPWWGSMGTATMAEAAVLAGPLQHMHGDIDLELDSIARLAMNQVDIYPDLATSGPNMLAELVDIADTRYSLPPALAGWLARRYTDSTANRVTYVQAIRHASPIADDPALWKQPNSGVELMSGNRNWTMIAGGSSAPPGDPGDPPGGTWWWAGGAAGGAAAGAAVGGAIGGPVGAGIGLVVGGAIGLFGGGLTAEQIAANKQHDKLWEDQPGVLRETALIPSPVGVDRSQTIRFGMPRITGEREHGWPRLCVAEGFMCGFDLQMPTHPFPNKDAASCPIRPKLLPFIQTRADSAVAGDTTIVQQLGCLTQTLRDVGGWAVWRFEFGMLAQGNGDPAGQERYLMAWIMTSQPGGRRLHLKWHLPGPHDWYNAQVYDVEVNPTSGDAPEGRGRITFETVGNADDTDTWQDGSTSFALHGVPDATWTLLVEGCDPTYGVFGIRTGHACHADILPKIAVNVAPPPRQSFSCAAHEDPRLGDYQNGGLVLEVGCGTSPYGLYVYVWDEPCEPKRACPVGFTDYGFVVAAPSRGWTWEDFRDAVKESMMSYFLTTGRPYLPNFDSATIRVPVSPATRLRDTTWVATDTGSSHDVTFRWLGRSSGDAQILDDTGAPALYATLGKPYDTWPTAMGHVTAPDVPGASSELLRSSGNGCFTLAGLLTVADSNPSGLLVDLRVAAAPRVETIPTTKLAGRCS